MNKNKVVLGAEALFVTLHLIILSFFTRLGVFAPAIVNGLLVSFGAYHTIDRLWGVENAWTGAIVAGIAMEAAGIGLSWNLDTRKRKSLLFIGLYLLGSWSLVWFGLNQGWLMDLLGFIMPIFAVALQTTVAGREERTAQIQTKLLDAQARREIQAQEREYNLAMKKEETKQARAEVARVKATVPVSVAPVTLVMPTGPTVQQEQAPKRSAPTERNGAVQIERTNKTNEFMAANPNASERQLGAYLGGSASVAHRYMLKWKASVK